MAAAGPSFSSAHRTYVKSLYRRILKNELDWIIRRDLWRERAIEVRMQFDRNRNISDPRALAIVLEKAEADLDSRRHPDPYRPPLMPDGTKWERNLPPPMFTKAQWAESDNYMRQYTGPDAGLHRDNASGTENKPTEAAT